jgi:hypothetical protein
MRLVNVPEDEISAFEISSSLKLDNRCGVRTRELDPHKPHHTMRFANRIRICDAL